ncbi:hypothetical protein AB0D11_02465 [Streptomyces monashensis]|uniref:hypothetical protein n=1 Tax=Streptomyces monashensis TaxID=1678012 RepID=UPI0033F7CAD0
MNRFATSSITTAGFALAVALLGVELWRWYKGGKGGDHEGHGGHGGHGGSARDPKALIPLALGIVCGILAVACPSGLLGQGAGVLRWGGNGLGGTIMQTLTGQGGTPLAQASAPTLDGYGAVVVTALFIALWLVRKQIPKPPKGKWKKGLFIGVMLCVSTGTAAVIAQSVVGGANNLGHQLLTTITTGTLT